MIKTNARIKELRKANGLSQEAFAARIGITKSSVSLIESGKNNPSEQTVLLICERFGVRREWLENGEEPRYSEQMPSNPEALVPALMEVLHDQPALLSALTKIVDRMDASDWKALNTIVEKAVGTKKDPEA